MKLVCTNPECNNEASIAVINEDEEGVNNELQFFTFEVTSTIHGNLVIKCKKCGCKKKGIL